MILFTFNCMTVAFGYGSTSWDGGGAGIATLICDDDTYSNCAGLPSNVMDTPPSDVAVPSVAATPVAGPRFVPKMESSWNAATGPTWVRLPPSNTHAIAGPVLTPPEKSTAERYAPARNPGSRPCGANASGGNGTSAPGVSPVIQTLPSASAIPVAPGAEPSIH